MRKLTTAAIGAACLVLGAGGATLINAATGPMVYNVYEATVSDEAAYAKDLSEIEGVIKENGGIRVAGGFNKSKSVRGKAPGNRFVIISWPNEAAFEKGEKAGISAWIEKHAPDAREVLVEGVERK
jgi:uncharacterized protein (DUF1330 family)